MKFLDRIIGRKSGDLADGYPDILKQILFGGMRSKSGATVNRETAFRVSAFLACVRVISQGVAQVPFKLLQESKSSVSRYPEIRSAVEHPLYDLLHRRPNDWQTSYEFRENMAIHAVLGNAYAFKNQVEIGGRRVLAELIPLDSARVKPVQNKDWSIEYKVRGDSGEVKTFPQSAIWHVRGPSLNSVLGMELLNYARDALGLAISTEETHASLHQRGVQPSGLYTVEGVLSKEQSAALKKWIDDEHAGATNKGGVMVLDRNAKFISNVMSGVDSQHLETRAHQLTEVCRFVGVLPLMVGYSDKTQTFASAEQMFLAHVVHCLMPWYERFQQSADVNLLTREERQAGYYTRLIETGLLRGAMKDTAEYLARLTLAGIIERNFARAKLELNPLEGLDEPLTPMNMTTDPTGASSENAKPGV